MPGRMGGTRWALLASALLFVLIAGTACGDDGDYSDADRTSAVDPGAVIGAPQVCAERLIEIVDADYMRQRGVVAEQGQEALFRLARERVIADVCRSAPAGTSVAEAAEEAAQAILSEAKP